MKALLVDDHALFREGLALLMGQRFPEVVLLQAHSLAEAQRVLRGDGEIDLVLLDLNLPDSTGLDSLAAILPDSPEAPVVVLSAVVDGQLVEAAIEAGASGFIPKTARGGAIVQALRVVLGGGVYLPPEAMRLAPVRSEAAASACQAVSELSRRQQDVLRWLADGKSNKAIARELDIAESSVKSHLKVIFKKLEVSNRAEAVLLAMRSGLSSPVV